MPLDARPPRNHPKPTHLHPETTLFPTRPLLFAPFFPPKTTHDLPALPLSSPSFPPITHLSSWSVAHFPPVLRSVAPSQSQKPGFCRAGQGRRPAVVRKPGFSENHEKHGDGDSAHGCSPFFRLSAISPTNRLHDAHDQALVDDMVARLAGGRLVGVRAGGVRVGPASQGVGRETVLHAAVVRIGVPAGDGSCLVGGDVDALCDDGGAVSSFVCTRPSRLAPGPCGIRSRIRALPPVLRHPDGPIYPVR